MSQSASRRGSAQIGRRAPSSAYRIGPKETPLRPASAPFSVTAADPSASPSSYGNIPSRRLRPPVARGQYGLPPTDRGGRGGSKRGGGSRGPPPTAPVASPSSQYGAPPTRPLQQAATSEYGVPSEVLRGVERDGQAISRNVERLQVGGGRGGGPGRTASAPVSPMLGARAASASPTYGNMPGSRPSPPSSSGAADQYGVPSEVLRRVDRDASALSRAVSAGKLDVSATRASAPPATPQQQPPTYGNIPESRGAGGAGAPPVRSQYGVPDAVLQRVNKDAAAASRVLNNKAPASPSPPPVRSQYGVPDTVLQAVNRDAGNASRVLNARTSIPLSPSGMFGGQETEDELRQYSWFHPEATRDSIEELLCKEPIGTFGIRPSSKPNCVALSANTPGGVRHAVINMTDAGWHVTVAENEACDSSLVNLLHKLHPYIHYPQGVELKK